MKGTKGTLRPLRGAYPREIQEFEIYTEKYNLVVIIKELHSNFGSTAQCKGVFCIRHATTQLVIS